MVKYSGVKSLLEYCLSQPIHSSDSLNFLDSCGGLVIPSGIVRTFKLSRDIRGIQSYSEVDGSEFHVDALIIGRELTPSEASEHPVWIHYCEGKKLLNKVISRVFFDNEREYSFSRGMGVFIPTSYCGPRKVSWCVYTPSRGMALSACIGTQSIISS